MAEGYNLHGTYLLSQKSTTSSTPLVWMDLEMTGLDPMTDEIIEIWKKTDNKEKSDEKNWKVCSTLTGHTAAVNSVAFSPSIRTSPI